MTHWSWRAGAGLLVASYLVQAAMIVWGPPPVKAAGVWFAAQPGMDPFIFGIGSAVAADWGHGEDAVTPLETESSRELTVMGAGYCDPDDPPWWC